MKVETTQGSFFQTYYNSEMERFKEFAYKEDPYEVPVICGLHSKEETSRMVFQIEEVTSQADAEYVYSGASFFDYVQRFFVFLNEWAVKWMASRWDATIMTLRT